MTSIVAVFFVGKRKRSSLLYCYTNVIFPVIWRINSDEIDEYAVTMFCYKGYCIRKRRFQDKELKGVECEGIETTRF